MGQDERQEAVVEDRDRVVGLVGRRVEVPRLVSLEFDEGKDEEVVQDSYEGPWTFSFAI